MCTVRKITSIILLSAMIALTGCSGGNTSSGDNSVTSAVVEETETTAAETEPSVSDTVRSMFGDKDYGGKEFRVLSTDKGVDFYKHIGSDYNEIWQEQENGEIMNDAIVKRNRMTEELLNIKIIPVWGGTNDKVSANIKTTVTSGSNDFEASIMRMDFYGPLMQNGYLSNLKSNPSIDTSHSWWDKNIVDNFTLFNSKLYWISGDINILDDYAVEMLYFNKDICADYKLEYPYQIVKDGTWTIDECYKMCKAVENDIDGDGKITVGVDLVGHTENSDIIKHWIYAMGEKSLNISEDGSLEICTLSERQVNAVTKLYEIMVDGGMSYKADTITTAFTNGTSLFFGEMLGGVHNLRDLEYDFGLVPMPKYNVEQEKYGLYVSNGWTTALSVPITCSDFEFAGTALEAMCGFSTDTIRTALYDVLLISKLIRDEETVEMLEISFGCKAYDWAVDFSWGSTFQSAYNGIFTSKKNNYVSAAEKAFTKQETTINGLLETISALPN